jgi:acyl transferase domain-containing protein/NADPH:quinone reductase-like Zn-dependent oxidoreductase/thioesterase domain-containing protein/acyl carrier protein
VTRVPIAVLGFGCRFPGGAADGRSYWELLTEGRDAVSEIPGDRWSAAAFATAQPGVPGKSLSRWGGFLDQIDRFEPEAFGISPREADYVDPQQRLLLETTWEALEMAGMPIERLAGTRTGVFVGISTGDYAQLQRSPHALRDLSAFTAHGTCFSIAANRLSYWLDLRGPSFSLDTACSSSLVALDRAVKSLREGESTLALAGGVNVILGPEPYVSFSQAMMLSPEGRCKSFDAGANGFVRAEGAGVLVLKRLADAIRDGDPIQAVLLGSGVNQDGRTGGLSMPNPDAQAALLREVYAEAGIIPGEIACIEAHGTGTAVGDPSEAAAIGQVFAPGRPAQRPVLLGSVKSNIGHLEAASGIASVIKAILMVRHRRIPPSLHFRTPNPRIAFDEWRLRVPVVLEPWPDDRPATVGVNSFGFGGTNAHVVVREFDEAPDVPRGGRGDLPLVLTARTPEALRDVASSWLEFLASAEAGNTRLSDIAFSAVTRRSHAKYRLGMAVTDFGDARHQIGVFLAGQQRPGVHRGHRPHQTPTVALVFSGQGPQWHAMGRELLAREPVFAAVMQECDRLLAGELGWSLLDELGRDRSSSRMGLTSVAQPALFALQVALAALWRSWGVRPAAVLGHSVGEIAAAQVAGILTLPDAARLVAHRGRCLQEYAVPGRMLAAALTEAKAGDFTDARVSIAAVNASRMVTFAGDPEAIARLGERLTGAEIWWKDLEVRHAFHSPLVEPAREPFLAAIGEMDTGSPECAMISTVTGAETNGRRLAADYWWSNVRSAVRFRQAMDEVARRRIGLVVEVGPHPVLSAAMRQDHAELEVVPSLIRGEPEPRTMVSSLAGLFARGVPVDWEPFWPSGGRCVELPAHPWIRQRYWHETPESRRARLPTAPHPLLGHDGPGARRTWTNNLHRAEFPWIGDHRVAGQVVFPAAGLVEMLGAAAARMVGSPCYTLDNVLIRRGLFLNSEAAPELETCADPATASLTIASRLGGESGEWVEHCQATYHAPPVDAVPAEAVRLELPAAPRLELDRFYGDLERTGLEYGPAFRGVREAYRRQGRVLALVELPGTISDGDAGYAIHPALLDGCLQTLLLAIPDAGRRPRLFLPESINRVRFHRSPGPRAWSEVRLGFAADLRITADFAIYTEAGVLALELSGFSCRGLPASRDRDDLAQSLFTVGWHHHPTPETPVDGIPLSLGESLATLVRRADGQARDVWLDRPITSVEKTFALRDRLARHYMVAALEDLCGAPGAGATVHVEGLLHSGRVIEQHRAMVVRCLEDLHASGQARPAGNGQWVVSPSTESPPFVAAWRRALARDPEIYPELRLIEQCGRSLPDVWGGRLDPLEVLFSRESTELLETVYGDVPWMRYANRVLRELLAEVTRQCPDRPLRILEVGGGTGATTRCLLPVLPPERTEYWFTDVSQFFLARAEQKLGSCGFLRARLLDLERDLDQQEIPTAAFDVVVAADVLHATTDVRSAVRRCAAALCDGGLLLLRESAEEHPCHDLVYGLTQGWWSYRGDPLRPQGPLLGAAEWTALLASEGFDTPVEAPACEGVRVGTVLAARRHPGPPIPAREPELEALRESAWLVFMDDAGVGQRLILRLRQSGCRCIAIAKGDSFQRIDGDTFRIDAGSPADLLRLRGEVGESPAAGWAVAWLFGTDLVAAGPCEDSLDHHVTASCAPLVYLLKAFAHSSAAAVSRLFLVTRGAQVLEEAGAPARFVQGALLGFGRVAASEFPMVQVRLIDLDPETTGEDALLRELSTRDAQEEVAWRGGRRFIPRLATFDAAKEAHLRGSPRPYEMVVARAGELSGVEPRQVPSRPPDPAEVRVEVRFAALNFRDVLKALGIYPADDSRAASLGDEGSGIVREVGSGVTNLRPGDRVAFITIGCFRSELTLPADQVVRIPDSLGLAAAAAMPVAFFTADYALRDVARLRRGESVLIHSAASGVGMAAMQLARAIGARIFATAGSPAKRELAAKLGAELAMDSRGLGFADEVRRATGGRGVDVVVNSLAGHAMERSLATLAPRGRFVELGQRDFIENTRIGLGSLRDNISYHAVNLAGIHDHRTRETASRLARLLRDCVAGRITPLPYRIYPASRLGEALRLMSQGGHQGKLVLDMTQPGRIRPEQRPLRPRPDGTYLITGAFGGVGLALIRLLVERGARHLVLIGRTGPSTEDARRALEEARRAGAEVRTHALDVADTAALAGQLKEIERSMPPLTGVFHLAMVLDDVTILNLDAERLRAVLRPKVQGAWNLHRVTRNCPLELFVLFGSGAPALGNVGQANYAAANVALESLASHRRAAGLPAMTIAWGLLGEVGRAAQRPELQESLIKLGIRPLTTPEMWQAFDSLIHAPMPVAFVLRADWRRLRGKFAAAGRCPGLLAAQAELAAVEAPGMSPEGVRAAIAAAGPDARLELARSFTLGKVAAVLGASASLLDRDQPLAELGLDSLMAVELVHMIESDLGLSLPFVALPRDVTAEMLSARLVQIITGAAGDGPASPGQAGTEDARPRLVHLAGDPELPPVYCVHPIGGDLAVYRSMGMALAAERSVHGIESRLLAGAPDELPSIEAMAEAYVDLILARHPADTAVQLVGFSMGGVLAVAMARFFESRGIAVAIVGLIECHAAYVPPEEQAPRVAAILADHLAQLRPGTTVDKSDALEFSRRLVEESSDGASVVSHWLTARGLLSGGAPAAIEDHLRRLVIHLRLLARSRPLAWCTAPLLVWNAADGLVGGVGRREGLGRGSGAVDRATEYHLLPTDHFGIMAPPHSVAIAQRLRGLTRMKPVDLEATTAVVLPVPGQPAGAA